VAGEGCRAVARSAQAGATVRERGSAWQAIFSDP